MLIGIAPAMKEKQHIATSTFKKWQWTFDQEQQTMWLNCEMDKQDKSLISLVGGHTFVQ